MIGFIASGKCLPVIAVFLPVIAVLFPIVAAAFFHLQMNVASIAIKECFNCN